MAKSTAVWLLRHTAPTIKLRGSCDLHILEVHQLDAGTLKGENPILSGQLTQEEIDRCTVDETATLAFQIFLLKKREASRIARL